MSAFATTLLYVAFLAGCAAIVYGLLLWSESAAWVVGGIIVAVLCVLTARFNPPAGKAGP